MNENCRDLSAINEELEISKLSSKMWNVLGQNESKVNKPPAQVTPEVTNFATNEETFKSIIERTISTGKKKTRTNYPHYNFNPSGGKSGFEVKNSPSNEHLSNVDIINCSKNVENEGILQYGDSIIKNL